MSATFDEDAGAYGSPDGTTKTHARDRTAGAGADAAGLQRNGERRPSEPLLETRGNQPHHAGMPTLGGGDDDRAFVFSAERGHGFGFRLRPGSDLDRLALSVEAVEFGGKARALGRIILQEQIDPERGPPDAAAGIDPWPQQKAEMPRFRRAADPRDVHQRGQPRTIAPPQRHKPF